MRPVDVAVIDDEQSIRLGCRLILGDQGHRVDVFDRGEEGLRAVLAHPYAIVLLDLKLPDLDGMEILLRTRHLHRKTYFIVMTGYSTVQVAVEAMRQGAFDYLAKPFSEEELLLALERALEKQDLVDENERLKEALAHTTRPRDIVGENVKIRHVLGQIAKVAPTDSTVLLCGESGTGKELFARHVHAQSPRATRPFVAVDCSTLSPNLLESELFGHVKGAFTGAVDDKAGIFEAARGGTLFLDDIANLTLDTQAKLLRVIEAREFKPVGSCRARAADVRLIAATNRDLKRMVGSGAFREDLYYRLHVFPVYLPPLRERRDDVPRLAYHFLRHFCRKTGKSIEGFSERALELLVRRDWPGNVRELRNVIERLFILADRNVLDSGALHEHLAEAPEWEGPPAPRTGQELRQAKKAVLQRHFVQIERDFILQALEEAGGNVTRAAEKVGMKRPNFHVLMKKHDIAARGGPAPAKGE